MKYLKIAGIVIVCALALWGVYSLFVPKSSLVAGVPQPNNNSNFTHTASTFYAGGGIVDGGGTYATSSGTGVYPGSTLGVDQLAEGEVSPTNLIQYAPPNASTTLTLPLFSVNGTLANQGDDFSFFLQNSTTTANVNITLAAATPTTTMSLATTTAVVPPGVTVEIGCLRLGANPYTGSYASTTCFVY